MPDRIPPDRLVSLAALRDQHAAVQAADQTDPVGAISREVGDRLRLARAARKLTLREAAELVIGSRPKLSHSAIARLETGKRQVVVDDLVALAGVYGVDPASLLNDAPSALPWSAMGRYRTGRRQAATVMAADLQDASRLSEVLVLVLHGLDADAEDVLHALPADIVSALGEAGATLAGLAERVAAGRRT